MSMTNTDDQDISVRDSLLVDNIMKTVAGDSSTAWRYRTIVKMNPYMANRPDAVAAMANMPIPTQDLMSQAGALYGMQVGNGFGAQLKQYDPSTQRSIFGQLTPSQQNTLLAFGYELPKEDVHGKGLIGEIFSVASWPLGKVFGGAGKLVSPVVSPTLDFLTTVGDYPFKVYRTIRQLDDASQWIALATGLATAGSLLLAPVTGGGSLALTAALTSARVGLSLTAGMAAAGAASLISSSVQTGGTSTWMNAWSAAYNGERLFTQEGLSKAEKLLEDPSLTALAQDLASESEYPGDLLGIAREIAGVRSSGDPNTRSAQLEKVAGKYAAAGTPQFTQAYDLLSELLTLPAFTEAVSVLERSKISMGRDIVRLVGGSPSTGWGRWLSGSIDAASIFLIDPFILAGSAARGVAQARRGIQFVDGVHSAERIRQVAQLPEMQRKLGVVARAVDEGDIALLNRGAREYRPIFDHLVQHRRTLRTDTFTADDVTDWLVGTDKLKSIMKGVGVVPGASYGQLRGLNRGQYALAQVTGSARDALRGISDIRIENVRLPKIVRDINIADIANVSDETVTELTRFGLSQSAARIVATFASNLPTRAILSESSGRAADDLDPFIERWFDEIDVPEELSAIEEARAFLTTTLNNSSLAYQVGRTLGNMPFVGQILTPFANLVEGMATRIPGGAIHITGLDAPEEIRNFIELFRYVGMPSYVRNMWTNAILQADTAGARLNGITALIDSAATATGMRLTKSGSDLIDEFLEKTRQIYSLGDTGRYATGFDSSLTQPIGVRPIKDMADMVAIPDLATMRKAVKQGTVLRAMLGISENTHILALQNKYWKPAVLLRAGFILRNVGEEMLSMLTRYSIGSWAQELTGRKIAQREEYFAAEKRARIKNQNSYLSPYERHVLRNRYDIPASLRPVARAIERIPDGQPWQRVLREYGNYIVDFASRSSERSQAWLLHGFGGQAAARMRTIGEAVSEETARGRLNTIINRLAFGNQYSLRRMIIGGIDEKILNDMRAFEGIYLKQIMDKVGTSNLSPWERVGNRAEALQRVLIDENSNERTELVTVLGERALSTRSNNLPNQQPWSEAVLSRTQELLDDPIVDAAMNPLRLLYNQDIEAALPRTNLINALQPYAEHLATKQKWDEDFLHLFLILNQGTPRPDRFRALLNRMFIPDDALGELADRSASLYQWAVRRNEVVKFLQNSFPGERLPDWETLSRVMKTAHDDFLNVEFMRTLPEGVPTIRPDDIKGSFEFPSTTATGENVVEIDDGLVDQLGYAIGYQRLRDQFDVFDRMAAALGNVNELGRDWFTNLIIGWHANPDLLHLPSVLNMTEGMAAKRPTFFAYRGMQYDDLVEVTEEGDLLFKGTERNWTNLNPSVSFSLNDYQALKYVTDQVGGQREGANEIATLFTINGDALIEAAGRSIDDVIGTTYDVPSAWIRGIQGGDVFIHTANAPKFPYVHVDLGDAGRREIAITDMSFNGELVSAPNIAGLKPDNIPFENIFGEFVEGLPSFEFAKLFDPLSVSNKIRTGQFSQDEVSINLAIVDEIERALNRTAENAKKLAHDGDFGVATVTTTSFTSPFDDVTEEFLYPVKNISENISEQIANAMEMLRLDSMNLGKIAYDPEKAEQIVENEIGRSLADLGAFEANNFGLTDKDLISIANQMFPGLNVDPDTVKLARTLSEFKSDLLRYSRPEMKLSTDVSSIVRIPKGSWQAATFLEDDAIEAGSKLEAILSRSVDQGYWPFYSSIEDARSAVKWEGHLAARDPRFGNDLRKNVDWHGIPETTPAYVVDTRPLVLGTKYATFLQTSQNQRLLDAINAELKNFKVSPTNQQTPKEFGIDEIMVLIGDAIDEQAPIIATTKETADLFANIIQRFYKEAGAETTERPLIAVTSFPADPEQTIKGFAKFEFSGQRPDQMPEQFGIYGWDGREDNLDNYRSFPLVWDWLDNIQAPPGPESIINRMVDHIEQRVRGGRRLQIFYREGENVAPVYRNINGEATQLEPGEMIQAHEQLYNSPRMRPGDRVMAGDQRYFEQGQLTYEGSNEVMWPVLAPVMYDHTESTLGWTLYDLKAPIDIPTVGDRRSTIFTDRQRIRYATREHVDKTPAGDLPDWEIVQLYRPVKKNLWERGVEFGFSNIIGPTIDAITRKPMAAHAFHIAAERNRNLTRWLIDASDEESALRSAISQINSRLPDSTVGPEATTIWADFGRIVGDLHGAPRASEWDDLQSIAFLRGFDRKEFETLFDEINVALGDNLFERPTMISQMNKVDRARLNASIKFVKANFEQLHAGQFDQTTDGFLAMIDRLFGKDASLRGQLMLSPTEYDALPGSAKELYNAIGEREWATIVKSAKQRASINQEVYDYAAEHTIRDIMPFVDSHEIRSQFAESMRGILPFWYAEENFLKRWAKIFTEGGPAVSFERIRKLQLTYQGLKSVGIVRSDAQGRDYFVYPGSELLFDVIDAVFPGQRLPLDALLQTPTAQIIPGFNRDFGRPSLTPFAAVSMDLVTTLMPEARPLEEAMVGKEFVYRNITDSIVPRHISNVWQALGDYFNTDINPKNERVAGAMMAAIAHLDANGNGLPDNATAAQRDEYLRRVRNHARIIVLSQAIGGLFTAGPAQLVQIPEGGSLDWITNGQVTNPAELLSAQYYELVRNLGIEKGTQRYLEINANATIHSVLNPLAYTVSRTTSPSGAPLPQTDQAYNFYTENADLLNQYPEAGPWLLPQLEGDQDSRSQYAYDSELVTGMRNRRTPQEFLTMLKYKEGANYYFSQQKIYESAYKQLKLSGRSERASELNRQWLVWSDSFKATHPLFAEMLVSDDARQRRRRVIDQMRYLIDDPMVPKAPHFEKLKVLQNSYDAYATARGELGLDRTARGVSALNSLKQAFNSWVSDYLLENPTLVSYWQTILEPEAGLE